MELDPISRGCGGEDDANAEESDESNAMADVPVFERPVSLMADGKTLEDALAELARQAGAELELDRNALMAAGLDLKQKVSINVEELPLGDAMGELIDWEAHPGVYRELRGGNVHITTLSVPVNPARMHVPEWLKPYRQQGLGAIADDDGEVTEISAHEVLTDDLLSKLSVLPRLRKLAIHGSSKLTPSGLSHLAQLRALESLEVHSLDQMDGLGDAVLRGVAGLRSLRTLSISESGTTDAGTLLLKELPQLRQLRLYQEGRLTDESISAIAALEDLESLDLTSYVGSEKHGRMTFTSDAVRQLLGLRRLRVLRLDGHDFPANATLPPRLQSLSVMGTHVDDELATAIAGCRELQSLSLSQASMTDVGLERISDLPKLRHLRLIDVPVTEAGFASLTNAPRLQHLELRQVHITDRGIEHLSAVTTLRRLDLSASPGLTIAGLAQLRRLPRLRTLYLTGFQDEVGYAQLGELGELRELYFEVCSINEETLHRLERRLPLTRIMAGTGAGFLPSSRSDSDRNLMTPNFLTPARKQSTPSN